MLYNAGHTQYQSSQNLLLFYWRVKQTVLRTTALNTWTQTHTYKFFSDREVIYRCSIRLLGFLKWILINCYCQNRVAEKQKTRSRLGILMTERISSSEISAKIYQITWCYIQKTEISKSVLVFGNNKLHRVCANKNSIM